MIEEPKQAKRGRKSKKIKVPGENVEKSTSRKRGGKKGDQA